MANSAYIGVQAEHSRKRSTCAGGIFNNIALYIVYCVYRIVYCFFFPADLTWKETPETDRDNHIWTNFRFQKHARRTKHPSVLQIHELYPLIPSTTPYVFVSEYLFQNDLAPNNTTKIALRLWRANSTVHVIFFCPLQKRNRVIEWKLLLALLFTHSDTDNKVKNAYEHEHMVTVIYRWSHGIE